MLLKALEIILVAVLMVAVISFVSNAQNMFPASGSAGVGTTTPNSSALLDVVSTSKGVLIPRMTKTQRDGIVSPATTSANSLSAENSRLGQNVPNPSGDQTTISYYLPQDVQSAFISVTDANGRVIKYSELNDRGEGQITIRGNELHAGTYQYSLVVNGKKVDTKTWVLVH